MGANFAKNIFTISAKCVGALREEGGAPKFCKIFFRDKQKLAKINVREKTRLYGVQVYICSNRNNHIIV